jgi:hypothetical protein
VSKGQQSREFVIPNDLRLPSGDSLLWNIGPRPLLEPGVRVEIGAVLVTSQGNESGPGFISFRSRQYQYFAIMHCE